MLFKARIPLSYERWIPRCKRVKGLSNSLMQVRGALLV